MIDQQFELDEEIRNDSFSWASSFEYFYGCVGENHRCRNQLFLSIFIILFIFRMGRLILQQLIEWRSSLHHEYHQTFDECQWALQFHYQILAMMFIWTLGIDEWNHLLIDSSHLPLFQYVTLIVNCVLIKTSDEKMWHNIHRKFFNEILIREEKRSTLERRKVNQWVFSSIINLHRCLC